MSESLCNYTGLWSANVYSHSKFLIIICTSKRFRTSANFIRKNHLHFNIVFCLLIKKQPLQLFFLEFQALICLVDKKTGEKSKTRPRFVKQDQVAIMRIECAGVICLEPFKEFPQMGRFTLRDESKFLFLLLLLLFWYFWIISV